MNLRRNILIFHQAALGDFITTWSVAMAMGRVFAQSRVMYVTGTDKGRLAEDVIGVEGLSADNGWHALHAAGSETVTPPEHVVRTLRGTQCVVIFSENDEPEFVAGLVKYCGEVPLIHIRPKPPADVHVLTHQLAQLEQHGRLKSYVKQMHTLLRTSGFGPRTPPGNGILIHPGSGSAAKNWPIACFLEVAERSKSAGQAVRFLVGEVEREKWPIADLDRLANIAEVVAPADLPSLRKTIAGAAVFLGNDSGPTHLAAALGLRTIALFGPASDVVKWQPTGPNVSVVTFDQKPADIAALVTTKR